MSRSDGARLAKVERLGTVAVAVAWVEGLDDNIRDLNALLTDAVGTTTRLDEQDAELSRQLVVAVQELNREVPRGGRDSVGSTLSCWRETTLTRLNDRAPFGAARPLVEVEDEHPPTTSHWVLEGG
ncbi:hypothetical protein GCM10009858_46130 [Terrabacter carboxydivorans]|uniref:Uncharacterized protein n=1 Tax=Terrabacter carboxydivorans TaxID=619730 RepID=A0ABP5ZSK5_9MICO